MPAREGSFEISSRLAAPPQPAAASLRRGL